MPRCGIMCTLGVHFDEQHPAAAHVAADHVEHAARLEYTRCRI